MQMYFSLLGKKWQLVDRNITQIQQRLGHWDAGKQMSGKKSYALLNISHKSNMVASSPTAVYSASPSGVL